ncbi:MAG: hypothetical protein QOH21_3136 [Acidobacteriota bacterium]|jgi:hypothetical protein|nr:hypothetical protein [Acidobacteriota bacterium]
MSTATSRMVPRGAADELPLRLLELVVQSSHDSTGGVGVVVLGERVGKPRAAEGLDVERLDARSADLRSARDALPPR